MSVMRSSSLPIKPDPTPISLQFYWRSYPWSRRAISPLRHREGWLKVSSVSFAFPFAHFSKELLACIDSKERRVAPELVATFFEMETSMPTAPSEIEPFQRLEEVTDDLMWDFIGETDQQSLAQLETLENASEAKIETLETRYRRATSEIEVTLRHLRKQRRKARKLPIAFQCLSNKIQQIQTQQDLLPASLSKEITKERVSFRQTADEIMDAITQMPMLETLFTVQWRMIG